MRQFEFTTATKEEITSKLDVFKDFQSSFNENLKISDYSEIYTSIFMIYQCYPANYKYFNALDTKKIKRTTKVIEIYSILDYDKIQIADEKKIKSILAETYLNSIEKHLKIKDFKHELFLKDIKNLLKPYILPKE